MPSEKRENLNSTEITTPTPEKKGLTKIQKYIAIAAIGILIGGGIVGGIVASVEKNNHPVAAAPVETTVGVAVETATAKENALKQKVEMYAGAMEKYKEMSVDSFEALPLDERLLYSQYIIDRTVSTGNYDNFYGEGSVGQDFAVEYTPVSRENNGQEIVDNFLYVEQISSIQFVDNGDEPYDVVDGQKCLSSVYYEVGKNRTVSKDYIADKAFTETTTRPTCLGNKNIATNTSDLIDGVDNNGDRIQYKIVTYYNQESKTYYTRFIYHEFTNYDGIRQLIWLSDHSEDKIEDFK